MKFILVMAAVIFSACVDYAVYRESARLADERTEAVLEEKRSTSAWPIADAAYVAPWEQTHAACSARRQHRIDDVRAAGDARLERIAFGRHYPGKIEYMESEGRVMIAEVMEAGWAEWKGCLAEYGWQLLPKGTKPAYAR